MTVGDDEAVDAAAATLDLYADRVARIGVDGYDSLVGCQFDSPKATVLVQSALGRRTTCTQLAEDLRSAARDVRSHAEWIRDKLARVRSLERRIRDWAAANPAGTSPTGADAALITQFPKSDTLEWEDLAARLNAQGIVF
jgi:hypothetical protein